MPAVVGQVWPLLAGLGLLTAAATAYAVASGDAVPFEMAGGLLLLAVLAVVGSFVVHETGHVLVVRGASGVSHVAVERTWLRVSVVPVGELTPGRSAAAAVAGPLAAVAVGLAGWGLGAPAAWCWCYLAHGLMLLPVFGDGRALVRALADLRGGASRLGQPTS